MNERKRPQRVIAALVFAACAVFAVSSPTPTAGYPTIVVIDREKKISYANVGEIPDGPLEKALDAALAEERSTSEPATSDRNS